MNFKTVDLQEIISVFNLSIAIIEKKILKTVETFTQMVTYLPQAPNLKCDENSFYPITHETQFIENKERVIVITYN